MITCTLNHFSATMGQLSEWCEKKKEMSFLFFGARTTKDHFDSWPLSVCNDQWSQQFQDITEIKN